MKKHLSLFEERLVEIVHILSYGTSDEHGLSINEVKRFLYTKLSKQSKTVLESLEENDKIIQEIKKYLET